MPTQTRSSSVDGTRCAAQLQVDRLLLVAHPLVCPDLLEAGEDQPRRDDQRGHLRGHLGHHGERQDRQALQRRVERRDLAAAQGVMLGDRIVMARPGRDASRPRRRGPAGEPRRPRGRARGRRSSSSPGLDGDRPRCYSSESGPSTLGHRQPARRRAEIGRHDLLLSSAGTPASSPGTTAWRDRRPRRRSRRRPRSSSRRGRSTREEIGSGSARACVRRNGFVRATGATVGMRVVVRGPIAVVMRMLRLISRRHGGRSRRDGSGQHRLACARLRAVERSRSTSSSESRISGKPILSSTVVRELAARARSSRSRGAAAARRDNRS